MLDGREFSILTDHKPITFALARATDAWTPRQGRHLSYIAEYTSDIRHIPGKDNVVADTMSRPPASPRTAGPDWDPHRRTGLLPHRWTSPRPHRRTG
jgi:hypothetical protein